MGKSKRLGLVGLAAIAALAGGLLFSQMMSAVAGDLSIGSKDIAPGASGTVNLSSDVGDPGLGAWTVDITYDPDVVTVDDCTEGDAGSVCNPAYTANQVRVTGASATGKEGDTVLSEITFTCGSDVGSSDLTLTINVFADATVGDPQDIDANVTNGEINCAVPPTAVPATATVTNLGPTGTGGDDSGGSLTWVIAALAGVGLVGIAGYGVLRARSRRA